MKLQSLFENGIMILRIETQSLDTVEQSLPEGEERAASVPTEGFLPEAR